MHSVVRPREYVALRLSSGLHKIIHLSPNTYVSGAFALCVSSFSPRLFRIIAVSAC